MATCFHFFIFISSRIVVDLDHKFFVLVHIIQCKSSHEYSDRSMLTEFYCYYMNLIRSCVPEADRLMFFPIVLTVI